MVDRPWESDDDRKDVERRQQSDKAVTGCFVWVAVAFAALVLLVIVGILDYLAF